jgi:putative transposase
MLGFSSCGARTLKQSLNVQLPKSWPATVRSAMLHVVSLARYAAVYTRSWAAESPNARVRFRSERDRSLEDAALVREEMRIKDTRMASVEPHRRPQYDPRQRLAILEVRAARGWSLEQTAEAFLVTPKTIASWMNRLDEHGPDALVQVPTPVNKFPDFVRYAVQRLQTLCPTLGKKKLAQVLARAGLHLAATTIGRIRKEEPKRPPPPCSEKATGRVVKAKRPNHVWHVDLTTVPTQIGFWCPWQPNAVPQRWPFCWWLAFVMDHYSRRVMGLTMFRSAPSSAEIRLFLGLVIHAAHVAPAHLISDKGSQFWPTAGYKKWCRRRGIKPRFGAIGKHGSLAVLERGIRTFKELLCWILVPTRRAAMRRETGLLVSWYNEHRPHSTLGGRTPDEVYFGRFPANRRPRIEPRPKWPRGSPCAWPQALVAGNPGARFDLEVEHLDGHAALPIVRLRRAA